MAVKKQTGGKVKSTTKPPKKKNSPSRKKAAPKKRVRKPAVKKSAAGRKAAVKKPAGKTSMSYELKKVCLGVAILLAICLTVAMLADIFIKSGRPVTDGPPSEVAETSGDTLPYKKPAVPKIKMAPVVEPAVEPPQTKKKIAGLKDKNSEPSIVYEVFDDVDPGHAKKPSTQLKPGVHTPQIAIIIDDIGYARQLALDLYEVDSDITFSILPFSPYGKKIAGKLGPAGAELMLHLPMEPTEYPRVKPGPGALLSSMSPDLLLKQLRKDLDAIPGVIGVNNHMGSKLTAQADKMNQIFTVLKQKNLFFIDSRTSPNSKGEASARLFMLRFSQRDIFLDNFQNVEYITGQFQKLIKAAHKHGTAIGIGHPYQATLDTLKIELPKLKGKIQVVRASRLVAIPG